MGGEPSHLNLIRTICANCNSRANIEVVRVDWRVTYVAKFVVEQEILGALTDLIRLPTDELRLERLQDSCGWASAVDEHEAEASWWMLQAKAGQHVGTRL